MRTPVPAGSTRAVVTLPARERRGTSERARGVRRHADRHDRQHGRQHDRRDRAADHRVRRRRRAPALVGAHGVPHGAGRRDAALRQARRPVRPQEALPVRDHGVRGRVDRLRRRTGPRAARRRARGAGHRWRRHRCPGDGRARGRRTGALARPLARVPGRALRGREPRRAAARRLVRRPPELALGVLRQPPVRGRVGGDRDDGVAHPVPTRAARHRLRGRRAPHGRTRVHRAPHRARRGVGAVVVAHDCLAGCRRRGARRRVRGGASGARGSRWSRSTCSRIGSRA